MRYGVGVDDFELGVEGERAVMGGLAVVASFGEDDAVISENELHFSFVDGEHTAEVRCL